jgi:peptidoglycan/LPS O-acetylase OafA/YrhL
MRASIELREERLRSPTAGSVPSRPNRPQLRALTGIRIFAALYVLLGHFALPLFIRDSMSASAVAAAYPTILHRLCCCGYAAAISFLNCSPMGVSLFFLLSGFILAYNYLDATANRRTTRREFWIARLSRVYPLYLLAWLIAAPSAILHMFVQPYASSLKFASLPLLSVLALHAWIPSWAMDWNSPSWSLCCESLFYLIFPLIFLRRIHESSSGNETRAKYFSCMILYMIFSMALPVTYGMFAADPNGTHGMWTTSQSLEVPSWWPTIIFLPLLRLPEMLAGVALGRIFLLDIQQGKRCSAWIAPVTLIMTLAVLCLRQQIPQGFYAAGALSPLFALLIYGLAHGGWLAQLMSGNALVLLGEASYALYILHVPLAGWFRIVAKKVVPSLFSGLDGLGAITPSWGYFFLYILFTLPLCVLSFKYFETPARFWIRSRLDRRRTDPSVVNTFAMNHRM